MPDSKTFTLRFLPDRSETFESGSIYFVNIYPFMDDPDYVKTFKDYLREKIVPLVRSIDFISYQSDDLRNDIRREILLQRDFVALRELFKARDLFAVFLSTFWYLEETQKIRWSAVSQENGSVASWKPALYIRGGNVELKVVENMISGQIGEEFCPNFSSMSIDSKNSIKIPVSNSDKSHWMDTSDINQNIADLMTNAGWYPNAEFDINELRVWANLYFEAYLNADVIFRYPGIDLYECALEHLKISYLGSGFSYSNFPQREKFYELLEGQSVLFLTPFAAEVKGLFDTGRIQSLWTDLKLPKFQLEVINSPMSIYPNRPGESWLNTFANIQESVRLSFAQNKHSLFLASAGSYGLPICNFVYSEFKIASVYGGNYINYLFGVRQNATENDHYSDKRDLSNWAVSMLGSIAGLNRVDDGRYIFTSD
jgi:hypothetical protein